jgi:uncharacterized membrane protein
MAEEANSFFTKAEEAQIVDAIKRAELQTSGEIRVHLENNSKGDNFKRARQVFEQAGMTKTKLRNGVLFYLAVQEHGFSILGDIGIHQKVGEHFWEDIKKHMQGHFAEQRFVQGLCEGIEMAGSALKMHFPYQSDDKNELPDEISKS